MSDTHEGFQKTILDGGLRVVTERMPHTRAVAIGVWIQGGARHDPPSGAGLSHFLEHMVFKGTTTRSAFEIATALERLGGHLNAFTEKEFVCFHATVLDEFVPQAIEILSDLVLHPLFSPEDIELEKRVVLEEIAALEDTPEDWIHDQYLATVFDTHPLGRPILGTPEAVMGLTPEGVRAFWRERVASDRIIVSAAGNLHHEAFIDRIHTAFTGLSPAGSLGSEGARYGKPTRRMIEDTTAQAHLCLGGPGLAYTDPDKFALILLNTYLGGGMSSRLFQELRERRGLAYAVYTFSDTWSDTGLFGVYAGTAPDRMEAAVSAIEAELASVRQTGIPASELFTLKSQVRGNLLLAHEDVHVRMGRIARMEAYTGTYMSLDAVIERIEAVTVDDFHRLAFMILDPDRRYLVAIRSRDPSPR